MCHSTEVVTTYVVCSVNMSTFGPSKRDLREGSLFAFEKGHAPSIKIKMNESGDFDTEY